MAVGCSRSALGMRWRSPIARLLARRTPTRVAPRPTWSPSPAGCSPCSRRRSLLYGFAVVLYGVLQAHRRFTAPALAPLVSSLVVIGAYLAFVPLGRRAPDDLAGLPRPAELMLSLGHHGRRRRPGRSPRSVPALRLRLRIRPTLRFPAGVGRQVRRAGRRSGMAALSRRTLSGLVVIGLANGHGTRARWCRYQYGWEVFVLARRCSPSRSRPARFPTLSARTARRRVRPDHRRRRPGP